jgi:hypothetical protein
MDRIIEKFKEFDMELLVNKKKIVVEELQKNKDLQDKLIKLLEHLDKAIEDLKYMNYDSD